MDGYQPIGLPQSQGPGFAEALSSARDHQRQQQMDSWNQMMQQGEADRAQQSQNVHMQRLQFQMEQDRRKAQNDEQDRADKVQEHVRHLYEAGLGKEAEEFGRLHGFTPQRQANPVANPGQAPQAPMEGPIDSPEHAAARARYEDQTPGAGQEPQAPFIGPIDSEEHAHRTGLVGRNVISARGSNGNPMYLGPGLGSGGMLQSGNIDLAHRPDVANADGTHSSVRSMSFEDNGREVLIPTVSEDGRVMSDEEAIQQYYATKRHLGQFDNPGHATAYAERLHSQQEAAGNAVNDVRQQTAEREQYQAALQRYQAPIQQGGDLAADRAVNEVNQQQAERDQYPEQMRKFEAQSRAYQEGEANPQFSYQTPGGQSFSVDPRERLMAARQQQKERATTLMGALGEQPGAERIGAEVGAGREPEQAFDDQTKRELAGLGMANKLELARMKQKKGGGGDGPSKEEVKDTNARAKEFRVRVAGTAARPGPLQSLQRIQSVIETMDDAIGRGDRTATTAAIEQGSRLLSGAAPTRTSTHLLTELQSASDELKSKVGKFFDDPGYSLAFGKRIQQLLRNTEQEYLSQIDDNRESFTEQELAAGSGLANKPALKHKAMGTLGMLGKVRNPDGSPRYQSDGGGKEQRPQQTKPAPPKGAPAGATKVNMPDGSVQEFDASGKRVK